jgi:conjugal transfer mating pair stabilization protein TraG
MLDVQILTYWNVETLYYVFNAVAALMAGAGYAGLIKMVFIFSIGIGMFSYMAGRQLELFTWFIQALIFVSLLNMPIARVTLTDKTGMQPPRTVDHVPFAMAIVAQATNMTFGFLTQQYETAFGIPDSLGLEHGDVGFGHRILKGVNQSEIQDPGLRADLMQFFKECTLYDIRDGAVSPQEIIGGTEVWHAIFTRTSPARFVTHNTLTSEPVTTTCVDGGLILKARVDAAVTAAQTYYGKQAFPLAQSDALAASMYVAAAGSAYDWILQSSQNASDATRQSMFNNLWRDAGTNLPAMLNDASQVAAVAALSAEAQAASQANGSNSVMSLLGQETLPHLRNWIEAILYAMFPALVILTIVVDANGAKKVIGGYMMALAWIGLWPVLFAVINHLSMMYLRHKTNAMALAAGVPFQLSDTFSATLVNEQAVIGYMVVLVPFIAAGIIRMGQGGIMGVADRAFAGLGTAGSAAGSGWATGNVSMGQVGLDTQAVNSTSMHKMNANIGLQGGGASIATASGGTAQLSVNGSTAVQQMHNRFLTSMATDARFDSQRTQEAHATDIAGTGQMLTNRSSDASSLNRVVGQDHSRGTLQSKGVDATSTVQGQHSGSIENSQSLHTTNRDGSTFHMAAGAHDRASMGGSVFARGGAGNPSRGTSAISAPESDPKAEARIASSMKQGGASPGEISQAIQSYRSQNRGGGSGRSTGINGQVDLGFQSAKTYDATHSRNKSHDDAHSMDERVAQGANFSEGSARSERSSEGEQSAQNHREGLDAARSHVEEHSSLVDVVRRNESGVGNRVSKAESTSFASHHDLLADPEFMSVVAHRNGMSAMRFYSQETPAIMAMTQAYAEERGVVAAAQQLHARAIDGTAITTSTAGLNNKSRYDNENVKNGVDEIHRKNAAKVGFSLAQPLKVDTGVPAAFSAAKDEISRKMTKADPASIPSRAAAFDENVQAWSSHDKEIGEGRANPMAVVERIEGRDAWDTVKKLGDKLTGGDGTADGEKLNANKKREDNAGF